MNRLNAQTRIALLGSHLDDPKGEFPHIHEFVRGLNIAPADAGSADPAFGSAAFPFLSTEIHRIVNRCRQGKSSTVIS